MQKVIARNMIVMVREINAQFPDGKQHVTCYTCHRGKHDAGEGTVGRDCTSDGGQPLGGESSGQRVRAAAGLKPRPHVAARKATERIGIRGTFSDMLRILSLALFTVFSAAFGQQRVDQPRFEVASIKPSDPNPDNPMFIGMSADGAMVKYTNITLRDCIRGAYRVRDFQIAGPDWMTKARFEISAKLPAGAATDQIPEMLQTLLAERFKLEIRRDSKEQNVYALMVGNGGAKLKPAEIKGDNKSPKALGPDGKPRDLIMYGFAPGGGVTITAPSASVASVAWLMSRFTARPIVDMTGIEGQYEFRLSLVAETNINLPTGPPPGLDPAPSAEPAPSVFDAVKQYGLRLEARKAPVEMLVVTQLEKEPTEN